MSRACACALIIFGLFSITDSFLWDSFSTSASCTEAERQCDDKQCVNETLWCDGNIDCSDGTDEASCTQQVAIECLDTTLWFLCENQRCISTELKCNGRDDCEDASDETNCTNGEDGPATDCASDFFRCDEGTTCIARDWLCDGYRNCLDFTDEKNCTCPSEKYQCPNTTALECISLTYLCDGKRDCSTGVDESNAVCAQRDNCADREVLCKDGRQCVDPGRTCDGRVDCLDQSDELNCSAVCQHLSCDHGCVSSAHSAHCVCRHGFMLDGEKTCKDVDECKVESGSAPLCSQGCENVVGSYHCHCMEGYRLDADNHRCRADGNEATLFLASSTEIRSFTLHTKLYSVLEEGYHDVKDIAVDSHDRMVFWTDRHAGQVRGVGVHGTRRIDVVKHGLISPSGIAYDWLNSLLYIVDTGRRSILACLADGEHCSVIIANQGQPDDIVVNPMERTILWTDLSSPASIKRSGGDGSSTEVLVGSLQGSPEGLVVDYTTNCMYWIDSQLHQKRIDSFCDHREKQHQMVKIYNIHNPSSLAIFEDNLYWSNHGRVVRTNKFTGQGMEEIVKDMVGVAHLDIMHLSLQPRPHDNRPSCSGQCSHICLPSNQRGFVCACPQDLMLDESGLTCIDKGNSTYLLIGRQDTIFKFTVGHIGNRAFSNMDVNYIHSMYLLDYDPVERSVVFVDKDGRQRPIICSAQMKDGAQMRKTVIVGEDISSVEGLAVDWVGRNVLWLDYIKKTIEVSRLDGSARAVVTDQSLLEPHSLAVYPDYGLLFYADWGEGPHIQRCNMDATNCFLVVHERLRQPNCLTVDQAEERLYWSDMKLGEIFSIHIDGSERSSPIFASHVKSIAVEGSLVYWTDGSDTVHVIDSDVRNAEERRYESGHQGLTGMTLVDASKSEPVENGCSEGNGDCSHICLATEYGATCLCPPSLTLSGDGLKCYNKECQEDETVCVAEGVCLSNKTICDGNYDCSDGSDEKGCPGTCSEDEFQCNDGTCLQNDWRCDLDDDCPEGEDELSCPEVECEDDEIKCDKIQCVPTSRVCDHHHDCLDGMDEYNCTDCMNRHMCADGDCIDKQWVCDNETDCSDGSDEIGCVLTCSLEQFQCSDGQCVERKHLCDGTFHCQDGSDEAANCTSECPKGDYRCMAENSTLSCLPLRLVCDGREDCQFGDDEQDCPVLCGDDEFSCRSKDLCIPDTQVCDSHDDCPDQSDESRELCNTADCGEGLFQCLSGECIRQELQCNRAPDCFDGSDETELCGKSCMSATVGCSHNCTLTNTGVQCVCPSGFDLAEDEHTCIDKDECLYMNGVCGQTCRNTKGGYSCNCVDGYELALDKHTCKATGERPFLLVADRNGISRITLKHKSSDTYVATKTPPVFIDTLHRPDRKLVVWTTQETQGDHNMSLIKMYRAVAPETILLTRGTITGLAVDWLALNLYYSQNLQGTGFISACSFQNKDTCKTLLDKMNWRPSYLVLHPPKGLMFWLQTDQDGMKIGKSWMDGSYVEFIVTFPTSRHIGLTLDPITDRLYWADTGHDSIRTANIDGEENIVILRRKMYEPFVFDFFENSLFLSQQMSVIQFSRFKEGKHKQPITIQKMFQPMGLKIVQQQRQTLPRGQKNPCSLLDCDQLCLILPDQRATCACRDGFSRKGTDQCVAIKKKLVVKENIRPTLKLKCLNGGTSAKNSSHGVFCSCPPEYTGFQCEVVMTTVAQVEEEDSKAWVAGVVLTILLVACVVAAIWFVRSKRKSIDLVSIIKFRNPAFKSPKDDDAEELVTEIAFGNPGFQDFDEIPEQDWLTKLVASTSQMSVDSAFASRQGSFVNPDPNDL